MESKWQKVFVACALGAFIGGIVALQLNGYFWWVGLIAGGFVGYITYEFKAVLQAIPKAWRVVIGWRPNVEYWKAFGKLSVYFTLFISTITVPLAILFLLISAEDITAYGYLLITPLMGLLMARVMTSDYNEGEYQSVVQEFRRFARFNALTTCWYVPKYLLLGMWYSLKGTWWLLRRGIPVTVVAITRFIWQVFKLIHSDERLLCGVDAAIGALVGYFTGNALIGAVFGGIFGVANFELVSKRLLHLVPAKHA